MKSERGTSYCGPDCPHEKPVRPGGDYPDDWIPAGISYAPPEDEEAAEEFEEHALRMLRFVTSRTFDGTCMECGFEWPIHVHEDREDQVLDDFDLWCQHCGSRAVVAQERGSDD